MAAERRSWPLLLASGWQPLGTRLALQASNIAPVAEFVQVHLGCSCKACNTGFGGKGYWRGAVAPA